MNPIPSPNWREEPAREGTYRNIFIYDPVAFKHPSAAWVKAFKEELHLSDDDFALGAVDQGDSLIELNRPSHLDPVHKRAIAEIVGPENVVDDDVSRVKFGHGKSLDEDLALRSREVQAVPDLVVHPRDKSDVARIVSYCHENLIPITIYSGGSGTVMGSRSDHGGIVLVMSTHMNQVLSINERNRTVTVQPGIFGPDYEASLNARGYTGGHFPQSFELSTVGGWISALGSGQASTYYGDAYDLVISQEYVTPVGTIVTKDYPAAATGPKLNDIFKGSEGTFGVLVEATMKIFHHWEDNRQRFAFMFPSWDAAVEAMREISQGEFGNPAILRISDPEETERGLAHKGFDKGWVDTYLNLRGLKAGERCLCIGTAEGDEDFAKLVAKKAKRIARKHGGRSLTAFATKQWEAGRYSDIYLREPLIDLGLILDTYETSVTWENIHTVYAKTREFIKSRPGTICMTHASHFYPEGTNLYFIVILKPEHYGEFFAFRNSIIDTFIAAGGSLSHHHGVGNLFAPWLKDHLGSGHIDALKAIKAHFDPRNIMNPGNTLGLK